MVASAWLTRCHEQKHAATVKIRAVAPPCLMLRLPSLISNPGHIIGPTCTDCQRAQETQSVNEHADKRLRIGWLVQCLMFASSKKNNLWTAHKIANRSRESKGSTCPRTNPYPCAPAKPKWQRLTERDATGKKPRQVGRWSGEACK